MRGRKNGVIARVSTMEDDSPFAFGDDLVDASNVKIQKLAHEPTLEDWICRQNHTTLFKWIKLKNQEKIQKLLSYDWNNPSGRIKQFMEDLLRKKANNPILKICECGDPTNGKLLQVFLNSKGSCDYYHVSFLCAAAMYKKMTLEELRMLLAHSDTKDAFSPREEGDNYHYHDRESAIDIVIRADNLEYFKEMLSFSKNPHLDKVFKLACKGQPNILKYLIDDRGMPVNDLVGSKTPLQHALCSYGERRTAAVDYLLSRGADVNAKDINGNTVIFYAAVHGHDDARLINADFDIRAKTNKMKNYCPVADGMTAFGLAAQHKHSILKKLFEFKSTMSFDNDFEQQVIGDVLMSGSYIAFVTMLQFVNVRDVITALVTERVYISKGDQKETLKPIEKYFRDLEDIQKGFSFDEGDKYDLLTRDSDIRSLWQHALKTFSPADIEALLNVKTKDGERLMAVVEGQKLLPEDYRVSTQIWRSNSAYNLGLLSTIPREIVKLIFSYLTFDEASQIAPVSKSWFNEITAKSIWQSHSLAAAGSSNPFRSIQKFVANSRIMSRIPPRFRQSTQVNDGEGLLVMESGFLTGLKLNGEPIISSWPQFCGSVYRCMARSRSLSRESIETAVSQIENLLNSGCIELDCLVDTLMPFMKCLSSGFYDITVRMGGDYKLFEFSSESNLSEIETEFPFYPIVYFTQPSDLLNKERVRYYEKQIQSGIRPAALAMMSNVELFIIDGHHKITAYKNLGLIEELVVVSISGHNEVEIQITEEEEMKYINHSRDVRNRYNVAKKSMRM